jgi:hypothetical protein
MPTELDAAALRDRLEERIAPFVHVPDDAPDDWLPPVENLTADITATLGTDPVIEFKCGESQLAVHRPAHFANAATWALLVAAWAEQDGDPDGAMRYRDFARVACEAAATGEASSELIERMRDSDGIEFDLADDYDAMCDQAGGVELIEAAIPCPARRPRASSSLRILRVMRQVPLRRSRPRERRASSRRSSRARPARPRPSEDGEADPPLALGAAA